MGNNITTMKISREFLDWLDTKIIIKGESYEDILRRLTGFEPRMAALDASQS